MAITRTDTAVPLAVTGLPLTADNQKETPRRIVGYSTTSSSDSFWDADSIVEFGSGDDSILIESSMLDAASVTNVPTGSVAADAVFDPVNGVIAGVSGDTPVHFGPIPGFNGLDDFGQFSFDVQNTAISNRSWDSEGIDHTTTVYPITYGESFTARRGYVYVSTAEALFLRLEASGAQGVASHSSFATEDFMSRITVIWDEVNAYIIINGLLWGLHVRDTKTAGFMGYWHLGGDRVSSGAFGYPVRNFVVSSKRVRVYPSYIENKIVWIGDSFASQGQPSKLGGSTFDDAKASNSMIVELTPPDSGFHFDWIAEQGNSGATINDDSADPVIVNIPTILAMNPEYVLYRVGTNDVQLNADISSNIDPDIKGHMTTILNTASVKTCVVGTAPTVKYGVGLDDPQRVKNVADVNDIINALPAWWDANNPSKAGRLVVADVFTAFGGESADASLFNGADIHPSAKGQALMGRTYADQLQPFLTGS